MTIQMTPEPVSGAMLIALAVANVLDSRPRMRPPSHAAAPPSQAGSQGASRACGSDTLPASAARPSSITGHRAAPRRRRRDPRAHRPVGTWNAACRGPSTAPSGNPWLDKAAVAAARSLRYSPEVTNCEAVAGSYALKRAIRRPR